MGTGRKKGPGGGGASLNFKVKDYATEELLMAATGKDNEIGIITSTPMTGWNMQPTQPEEMLPGEVWIRTSTNSQVAFNVLKKGGTVMVYPISAKQMGQDGVLADVTSKSWQDGEWVDWWNGHLYEYGNLHEQFTGGWTSDGYKVRNYKVQSQFNADNIRLYNTNGVAAGGVGTVNKIDLSNHKKLYLFADVTDASSMSQLSVLENKSDDIINRSIATAVLPNGTGKKISLDISAITEGYIAIGTSATVIIYDVWLE